MLNIVLITDQVQSSLFSTFGPLSDDSTAASTTEVAAYEG